MKRLLSIWIIVRTAVYGFIEDNALSHAAAMAFYAATSLAPILLIVIAVAGLVVGRDAAELALSAQLTGLLGPEGADLLKAAIQGASQSDSGVFAAAVALVTLLASASGVFGEMQASLNKIWRVEPLPSSLSGLVRARAASLGLVAALGFLLLVSLAASAAISGLGALINARLPLGTFILSLVNTVVSLSLLALLFGAIYKVLPDRSLAWFDVRIGAIITAILFTIGKSLIGWYLGTSAIASSYGAAGSLIVVLLWVFYSSSIFLLGAELTRAYATTFGTRSDLKKVASAPAHEALAASTQTRSMLEAHGPKGLAAVAAVSLVSAIAAIAAYSASRRPPRS